MATLQATIPDDLQRAVVAVAAARGVTVHLLVEQALRYIVAAEPFSTEAEADVEIEAMQAEVLSGYPWEE